MAAGKFSTYKGRKQGRQVWRWKTVARNGRKTGTSGEAFVNESDAFTGALTTARIIAEANGYQLVRKPYAIRRPKANG